MFRWWVLLQVIFFPWKFIGWRLISAFAIDPFLHRHTDAPVINPDVIWPAAHPENSI